MKTNLKDGAWVSYRMRGEIEIAKIVMNATCIEVGGSGPPIGAMIQPCVWKPGDVLEARGKAKEYK